MCGIAGIINLDQTASVPREALERMAAAIYHRGPDEDGFYYRKHIGMASRRLSIVGLEDGRQPISNENGQISVVFNGELFDYVERRSELQKRGHKFRTHSDTEIIPHLWEDHGEDSLVKLRGQFAIALVDEKQQRLILARDRFGICPLFWTRQTNSDGDWLLFASEIKALLASGMVEAKPDVRGLNQIFTFFANPGPMSCFAGIQMIRPGHYLSVPLRASQKRSPQIQETAFWQVDFPDQGEERDDNPTRLADELESLLMQSVERRLRADVPVVSYLSSGVDSSLVVALAARQRARTQGRPIPTYTIRVNDPHLDEADEAAELARYVGTETSIVDCGKNEVLEYYPELIRAAEVPVVHTACAASLMLAKKVHADGYKAVLTGEGADEWLAGYPWFKAHKVLSMVDIIPGINVSQSLRRAYMRLVGLPPMPHDIAKRNVAALGGLNAYLNIYGLFSTGRYRFFSSEMWEKLGDHVAYEDLQMDQNRASRWHPLNRSVFVGARVMLPGMLLSSKGDRVAMNSSVEARYPFLDEDLFDFCAKLHPRWKLHGLREKYLLRRVAERWLPKNVAWRRKAMFRTPRDGFHHNEANLPRFVDQLLSEPSLRKTGYFDTKAVLHWRNAFRNMRENSAARVMVEMCLVGVVATQLWHHTFIDGTLAEIPAWSPPTATPVLAVSQAS